jgi:hypothetical protein
VIVSPSELGNYEIADSILGTVDNPRLRSQLSYQQRSAVAHTAAWLGDDAPVAAAVSLIAAVLVGQKGIVARLASTVTTFSASNRWRTYVISVSRQRTGESLRW